MTKRRRERDRPKAGPESLYNPNKRVHLSYADSDEEEGPSEIQAVEESRQMPGKQDIVTAGTHVLPPGHPGPGTAQQESLEQNDNDEYEPGGDEEQTAEVQDVAREAKRKSPEYRSWEPSKARQQTKRNTETIGCLQFPDDDDGGDDEDLEVAKYMRAVQSQRKEIPQILYAAAAATSENDAERKNGHYANGDDGDQEAGYEDGAFFARSSHPTAHVIEADTLDPRTVFTDRLITRFHAQRITLHIPATIEELTSLSDATLITFPPHAKAARKHWLQTLRTQPPLPAQIRSIDQPTALNLLELIADSVLLKATDVTPITSAWIWSLLARIDDVGNLYNDEIFPLRQLGKKALFVLLSFKDPEAARGIEELDDNDPDYDDDRGSPTLAPEGLDGAAAVDGGAAKRASGPTSNTLATLDMVLTIVGQVFGQKDLLQFRQAWDAAAEG
jgi:hypothetical protein